MEPSILTSSPDKLDLKPSFRKPTNEAASRKYRRHSPVSGSDSSSSGGSPRRERSHSPLHPRKDHTRTSDDRRRKDVRRELERDSSRNRSGRGHDSQKHSERHPYGNSHDYRRHDDYIRHHRHVDEDSRNYQRSSRSGRDSRNGSRSDYTKSERISDRYRDNWQNVDKHSKDKTEISEHKNKEREPVKDYDRTDSGNKQVGLSRDYDKFSEQDQRRDRESRDYKKDHHRSPGSHKNDQVASHEKFRGYGKDSSQERDTGTPQHRESEKSSKKDFHGQQDLVLKRKYTEMEGDKLKEKYTREQEEFQTERRSLFSHQERDGRNDKIVDKASELVDKQNSSSTELKAGHLEHGNAIDGMPSSSSRQVKETHEKVNSDIMNSSANNAEANDVNSAKVAALKAAELVNMNLVGFGGAGYLSTDQKKRLLWGNKKNNSTEESSRWDLHLFQDQERQEKFNRLMSLRLPLWLWPIVGCEGQCSSRVQTRQQGWRWKPPSKETGGARYRSGEAIYCWASAKRWSHGWPWLVMTLVLSTSLFKYTANMCGEELYKLICHYGGHWLVFAFKFLEMLLVAQSLDVNGKITSTCCHCVFPFSRRV